MLRVAGPACPKTDDELPNRETNMLDIRTNVLNEIFIKTFLNY